MTKSSSSPTVAEAAPTDAPAATPAPAAPEGGEDEIPDFEDDDQSVGFLYKFHSRYRKQRTFNISIVPKNVSREITLPNGEVKFVDILWENREHKNTIWIKHFDKGADGKLSKSSKNSKVFTFFDDEVNPRTDAGKSFTIEKIYKAANPSKDPFSIANKQLVGQLKGKEQMLFRCLYAVVYRKSMEFVHKHFAKKKPTEKPKITPAPGVTDDGLLQWDATGLFKGADGATYDPEMGQVALPEKMIGALAKKGYPVMFPTKFKSIVWIKPGGTEDGIYKWDASGELTMGVHKVKVDSALLKGFDDTQKKTLIASLKKAKYDVMFPEKFKALFTAPAPTAAPSTPPPAAAAPVTPPKAAPSAKKVRKPKAAAKAPEPEKPAVPAPTEPQAPSAPEKTPVNVNDEPEPAKTITLSQAKQMYPEHDFEVGGVIWVGPPDVKKKKLRKGTEEFWATIVEG
jgi:hypothetical protein